MLPNGATENQLVDQMTERPIIRVFHNLARSGGTLVSRCIASMNRICLLSEIHSLGRTNRHFSAIRQYQMWYRDLGYTDWKSAPFDRSIDDIHADCESHGEHLVLRDWAHIDFLGPPSPKPPSFEFGLDKRLEDRYQILHCALVRHPAETWRSTSKMSIISDNGIDVCQFLFAYRRYLEAVSLMPIIRYEDFTAAPLKTMAKICGHLELPCDQRFLDKWNAYVNVTGDMFNHSRASGRREIIHFEIAELDPKLRDVYLNDENYRFIISKLKYPF